MNEEAFLPLWDLLSAFLAAAAAAAAEVLATAALARSYGPATLDRADPIRTSRTGPAIGHAKLCFLSSSLCAIRILKRKNVQSVF